MKNNELKTADPKSLGIDPKKLSQLDSKIRSDCGNIDGIVIIKNGCIAFEKYYLGFKAEDTQHIASVTKSIISALIGIAIDKGYIKSTEEKVLDFFPEYIPEKDNENIREISIKHLLTMTAPYPYEPWHEPLDKLSMSPDWIKYTLSLLGKGGTIGEFKYSTAGAHLLSAIINRSTGKSAREFANEYLFKPSGMKEIADHEMKEFSFDSLFGKDIKGWVNDPQGNSTGGWGLKLTVRDMARFGLLYLKDGLCDGKQVVLKSWIEESIAANENHYGYLWWLFDEKDVFAYAALGDGGNAIVCIPKEEMVVAIASEFMLNPYDRWKLIKESIL